MISIAIVFASLEFRKHPAHYTTPTHYTTPGQSILSAVPQEYIPPALANK